MITEKERERTRDKCQNYQELILQCAEKITRLEFNLNKGDKQVFVYFRTKPERIELLKKALIRLKKRHDELTKQTLYEN